MGRKRALKWQAIYKVIGRHGSDNVCPENCSAMGMYGKCKVELVLGRAQAPACLAFHVWILNVQQLSYFLLSTSPRPSEGWQQTKSQERATPTSAYSGHQSCGRSLCVLALCGKQCHFAQGIWPAVPWLDFPNPHLHALLTGLVLPSPITA